MSGIPWPSILTGIGMFLTIVGTLWTAAEANKKEVRDMLERDRLKTDLIAKNEEIIHLQNKITETITGGESYAELVVVESKADTESPILEFMLINQGDNLISDIYVSMEDQSDFYNYANTDNGKSTIERNEDILDILKNKKTTVYLDGKNLPKNSVLKFLTIPISSIATPKSFSFSIQARNFVSGQFVTIEPDTNTGTVRLKTDKPSITYRKDIP